MSHIVFRSIQFNRYVIIQYFPFLGKYGFEKINMKVLNALHTRKSFERANSKQ